MTRGLAIAVLSACSISTPTYTASDADGSNSGDDVATAHSGTRLQVVRQSFGASSVPIAIHDAKLDVDCLPTRWSDGQLYCTPDTGGITFSDSACTTRVIVPFDSTRTTGLYAIDAHQQDTHVYHGGDALPSQQLYDTIGTECEAFGAGQVAYAVDAEITPSDLVAVTYADDPGALAQRYTHGADGLQTFDPWILHDNTRDADCYEAIQTSNTPTTYCAPAPFAIPSTFADSACTQPIVNVGNAFGAAYALVFPPANVCFLMDHAYPIEATTVTPAQVFQRQPFSDQCLAATLQPSMYFTVGSPAPLFPLVRRPANQSGRRIVNAMRTSGDLGFVDREFYDTMLGAYCSGSARLDGELACIPESLPLTSYFSDAACTTPILAALAPSLWSTCGFSFPAYGSVALGPEPEIRPLLPAGALPPLYQLDAISGACGPVADGTYLGAGDPIPRSMFATGSVVVDPVAP